MTPDQYQADCLLTESHPDIDAFLDTEDKGRALMSILTAAKCVGDRADKLKKHLFYGRDQDLAPEKNIQHEALTLDNVQDKRQMVRLLHALLGVQSEVAEMIDALLPTLLEGKPLDLTNAMEEGGDNDWYLSIWQDALGFKRSEAMGRNIAKLAKRYPGEKFTSHAAFNRDLDAERQKLEGE